MRPPWVTHHVRLPCPFASELHPAPGPLHLLCRMPRRDHRRFPQAVLPILRVKVARVDVSLIDRAPPYTILTLAKCSSVESGEPPLCSEGDPARGRRMTPCLLPLPSPRALQERRDGPTRSGNSLYSSAETGNMWTPRRGVCVCPLIHLTCVTRSDTGSGAGWQPGSSSGCGCGLRCQRSLGGQAQVFPSCVAAWLSCSTPGRAPCASRLHGR